MARHGKEIEKKFLVTDLRKAHEFLEAPAAANVAPVGYDPDEYRDDLFSSASISASVSTHRSLKNVSKIEDIHQGYMNDDKSQVLLTYVFDPKDTQKVQKVYVTAQREDDIRQHNLQIKITDPAAIEMFSKLRDVRHDKQGKSKRKYLERMDSDAPNQKTYRIKKGFIVRFRTAETLFPSDEKGAKYGEFCVKGERESTIANSGKKKDEGPIIRDEFSCEIPYAKAYTVLNKYYCSDTIEKIRYHIKPQNKQQKVSWTADVFLHAKEPVVIFEAEAHDARHFENLTLPLKFAFAKVTNDEAFGNDNMARERFSASPSSGKWVQKSSSGEKQQAESARWPSVFLPNKKKPFLDR